MTTSASINIRSDFDEVFSVTPANLKRRLEFIDFFNFVPAKPIQDVDLIRQLSLIPGLKEILMLRQVHALEHATVWVLSELDAPQTTGTATSQVDNELLGRLSTEQGFYLYGQVNKATRLLCNVPFV